MRIHSHYENGGIVLKPSYYIDIQYYMLTTLSWHILWHKGAYK